MSKTLDKYDTAQSENKTHNDKQLFWTKVAAFLLLLAAGFAGWQGYSTKKAADAANSAARTARETLIASNRPWIAVGDVSMDGPLTLAMDGHGGGHAKTVLKNVGHSVARLVVPWIILKPATDNEAAIKELDKLCEKPKASINKQSDAGYVLFPDQSVTKEWPLGIYPKEVEQTLQNGPASSEGGVSLYLLICIDYKSSLDEVHHQTRLVRLLVRTDEKTGRTVGGFYREATYNGVLLTPIFHGDFAD